ncbi:hypothetical protein [Pyrococcus yayanosii]|uniref:Oligosaccharide repeat unit polymerase n=1 Tax=Pyrococcus yayanosii (strain CH1 / JCM 16557) TaxID=529709 RepID=F8AGF4_PYRYC|nr:hypothetical protein [Pyrococcus yayanosii]AEH25150.1 hypothetical protein PYCH_14820 [Pyrococcus yayanosii CH1]
MDRAYILWAVMVAYISLAIISKLHFDQLPPPKPCPLLYALAFTFSMFLGYHFAGRKVPAWVFVIPVLGIALLVGPLGFLPAVSFLGAVVWLKKNPEWFTGRTELMWKILVVSALLLPLPVALMGAIPLLDPATRYSLLKLPYLASAYLLVFALSYKPDSRILILGLLIALVSTFRSSALLLLAAYVLRKGKVEGRVLGVALFLLLIIFLVRHVINVMTYGIWRFSLFEELLYRIGFTYSVYERLFELGMPIGRLELLPSINPRLLVGSFFGKAREYTYTIFGQPVYDFGIFGLLESFFLGFALGRAVKNPVTGVSSLSILLVSVESGLDAFKVPAIFALAILSEVSRECGGRS